MSQDTSIQNNWKEFHQISIDNFGNFEGNDRVKEYIAYREAKAINEKIDEMVAVIKENYSVEAIEDYLISQKEVANELQ